MSRLTVPEVLPRFRLYRAANPCWGSLHIVLEDRNLANHHVQWCADHAREEGDEEGAALADILLQMTRTQRDKIGRQA